MKLPPLSAWKLSGQSINQTTWSASIVVTVTHNWSIQRMHLFACAEDGVAAKSLGLRAETATIWPSCLSHTDQQNESKCEFHFRPKNQSLNFRKTNLKTKLYYKTSEECHHARNITRIGVQSLLLGLLSYYFHSEIQDCPCIGALDVNSASRQPTSHWNRHSEATEEAGIARKQRATALIATQHGYASTYYRYLQQVHRMPATCASTVMCEKIDNRWYILKTYYWLETGLPITVLTSLLSIRVYTVAQQANWSWHFVSRYCTIFTYQEVAVK